MSTKNIKIFLTGLGLLTLAAGCGGQAYKEADANGENVTNVTQSLPSDSADTWDTEDDGDEQIGLPAERYIADITGVGGSDPYDIFNTVTTDNLLTVRVKALEAGAVEGTTYTNSYRCVSFRVTVNGQTKETGTMKVEDGIYNGWPFCTDAPSFKDLSFSMTQGHTSVSVKISNAASDIRCLWGYLPCSITAIPDVHVARGEVQIQTNGTYFQD